MTAIDTTAAANASAKISSLRQADVDQVPEHLRQPPPLDANVHWRIAYASHIVRMVGKGGTASDSPKPFSFRKVDDVVTELNRVLPVAGLWIKPITQELETHEWPHWRGSGWQLYRLHMTFRIYGLLGDYEDVPTVSEAVNNDARGVAICQSYALKHCLSQTFMIPFADEKMDPEAAPEPERLDVWQAAGWENQAEAVNALQNLKARTVALPPAAQESVKRRLALLNAGMLARSIFDPSAKTIATKLSFDAAVGWQDVLTEYEGPAAAEAAGQDPFLDDPEPAPAADPVDDLEAAVAAAREVRESKSFTEADMDEMFAEAPTVRSFVTKGMPNGLHDLDSDLDLD